MPPPPPELEVLFIDMNAFFASVEQIDRPDLRGRPVGVAPVTAPSGCCIAASYEARAEGVKTGTRVGDARRLCPAIEIVKARPDRYIAVHHEVMAAIESVIPVTEIESVDECRCRLLRNEQDPRAVNAIAAGIKAAIRERVGPLTCSVGASSNRLLAKVAAGMQKPDGLTLLPRSSLPGPLLKMNLTDLPGISTGINRRLRSAGIRSIADMLERSPAQLQSAWGSVVGIAWWHWLRGDELPGRTEHRRTVGHQHVLAPDMRTPERARGVALRLLSKAAQRMRSMNLVASRLSLSVRPADRDLPAWHDWSRVGPTDDTAELTDALLLLWSDAPSCDALQVGVRLEDLEPADAQLPLFPQQQRRRDLMHAIDRINRRGGADTIYPASMHHQRQTAPRRIPFGKPPSLDLPDHDGSTR